MGTVRIDGEVKQITTGRKLDSEGNPKLVARVLIEFVPTEKGISELQDLIALQELPVNILITGQQRELFTAAAKLAPEPGSGVEKVTLSTGEHSVTLTQEDGKRLRKAAGK